VEDTPKPSPGKAESLSKMGDVHLREGRYRAAMKHYMEAEALNPNDPDLKMRIGHVYADYYKRLDEAIPYYQAAIQLKENYSEAYNNLGTIYLRQQRWDEAISMFQKALDNLFYTTPEKAYSGLAAAHRKKGENDKALEYYQMAIELKPEFVPLYVEFGLFYRELKQEQNALRVFQEARFRLEKQAPKDGKAPNKEKSNQYYSLFAYVCFQQGRSFEKLRRYPEAREAYQRALEVAPSEPQRKMIQQGLDSLP
jgi:tetratricopeptide (TPR) repeat protein